MNNGNRLKQIINANRLHQIIDKPTRVTPDSATLLDVLITNKPESIIHSDVLPKIIADHDLISTTINITKPKRTSKIVSFRHHGSYTKDAVCTAFLNAAPTLNNIFSTDDVNVQADTLTFVMVDCLDQCAPVVTTRIKKKNLCNVDQR